MYDILDMAVKPVLAYRAFSSSDLGAGLDWPDALEINLEWGGEVRP